ncbi:MAG: hypothetical protein CSB03_00760, partial [Bacteroidia bacterium]
MGSLLHASIRVVDKKERGIEGVYVQFDSGKFTFSNKYGIVEIADETYTASDSLTFSHLNFKTRRLSVKDALESKKILLDSDVKQLGEVVVSNVTVNYEDYVREAIQKISQNYEYPFTRKSIYDIDFLFSVDNTEFISYKGGMVFSIDRAKKLYVSKVNYQENINPAWEDYVFDRKPYSFTTIVHIASHSVIYNSKKFAFYDYKEMEYKGKEALKVSFKTKKEKYGQSGTMIINKEDKAIVQLSYVIHPVKNWIVEKTKSGLVKTSLQGYYVESDYVKTDRGKYNFNSGRERILLEVEVKKQSFSTLCETYLKRKDNLQQPKTRMLKEQVFE